MSKVKQNPAEKLLIALQKEQIGDLCEYPQNSGLTSYAKGCRCSRCKFAIKEAHKRSQRRIHTKKLAQPKKREQVKNPDLEEVRRTVEGFGEYGFSYKAKNERVDRLFPEWPVDCYEAEEELIEAIRCGKEGGSYIGTQGRDPPDVCELLLAKVLTYKKIKQIQDPGQQGRK